MGLICRRSAVFSQVSKQCIYRTTWTLMATTLAAYPSAGKGRKFELGSRWPLRPFAQVSRRRAAERRGCCAMKSQRFWRFFSYASCCCQVTTYTSEHDCKNGEAESNNGPDDEYLFSDSHCTVTTFQICWASNDYRSSMVQQIAAGVGMSIVVLFEIAESICPNDASATRFS